MTEMKVDAIRNGSVIDHLPPGKALEIIRLLNVNPASHLLIGTNLCSRKLGTKDILKIENHELSQEEVNTIALLAPYATLTIIRDYKVEKKAEVQLPETLTGIFICPNPHCVTNHEKVSTRFRVSRSPEVKLKCDYCEKIYGSDEVIPQTSG